jgi:hypothetical protein
MSADHNCPGRTLSLGRQEMTPGQWEISTDRSLAPPRRIDKASRMAVNKGDSHAYKIVRLGNCGFGVLASFATAMLVAFVAPRPGFGLICGALIFHLRPEAAPASRRDAPSGIAAELL